MFCCLFSVDRQTGKLTYHNNERNTIHLREEKKLHGTIEKEWLEKVKLLNLTMSFKQECYTDFTDANYPTVTSKEDQVDNFIAINIL